MKRVFATRHFFRWFQGTGLDEEALMKSVDEMMRGLIDADLGGGIVKKRIGLPGRGKRGGARTLVATNKGNRWFFLYGFEKNEHENVSLKELRALQAIAKDLLNLTPDQLAISVREGSLKDLENDNEENKRKPHS